MAKPKVLVTRAVFPDVLARLESHFEVEANQEDRICGAQELGTKLQGKQGVFLTPSERIDASLIAATPSLKAICNMAVGFNNIDVEAATRAGVIVTNTPDVLNETTADFAWALLLATARRVTESEHWLRAGKWQKWRYDSFLGADVHGSTLGIIGMGRIGQAIARRSIGFDMRVVYHNRSRLTPALEERANHAQYVDKHTLLQTADHVMLALPYSQETHHTIGAAELALIDALRKGRIAAAGLDVFENEPAFNPAFLGLSNVVLTPHIASASEPTRRAMANCAADNLIAALTGGVPPNLLNPQVRSKG